MASTGVKALQRGQAAAALASEFSNLSTASPSSAARNMKSGQHASIRDELVSLFNEAIQIAFPGLTAV